jgi:hypothetical protein
MQVNQRSDKRQTLSTSSLRKNNRVSFLKQDWNSLHLHRCGSIEPRSLDFVHELIREMELILHLLEAINQHRCSLPFNLDPVVLLELEFCLLLLILETFKILYQLEHLCLYFIVFFTFALFIRKHLYFLFNHFDTFVDLRKFFVDLDYVEGTLGEGMLLFVSCLLILLWLELILKCFVSVGTETCTTLEKGE